MRMASPNEITVTRLLRLIGTPDAPVIVDIRIDPDFEADPCLIPGSFREPYNDVAGLVDRLAGRRCVVICQKGLKLSQGLVTWLRGDGLDAEYLQGGMFAWRDHPGAPRLPAATLPACDGGATLWVTRHRPKIDRIACPWLIRRFVDPGERFPFVSPDEVARVADLFDATPFDVEAVFWSQRGALCTFDTMLDEFGLRTEALDRLALVVRGADTNRHDLAPEAAGLLALSVGLSWLHKDDQKQLEAGLPIYDALYRWARDGAGETHDWIGGSGA
jgi:rhodanese-related sulfurtransferase